MFHPNGPNFLLSYIMAWKKHSPKLSFCHSRSFFAFSNWSWLISWKLFIKFALRPLGGSVVNFTPFYRTVTGKYSAGIDVKNNLKSGCIYSSCIFWTIISKLGIQDLAKWQFYNNIHSPFSLAIAISFSALIPWPCPSEIPYILWSKSLSLANLYRAVVGSAP